MNINTIIKSILLVDDDELSHVYNKVILKDAMGFTGDIKVCYNGKEAFDFLQSLNKSPDDKGNSIPDMILLDINMPIMNGFEFLEAYNNLPSNLKAKIVICMLTTSINNSDKDKVDSLGMISQYFEKPLDENALFELIMNFQK